MINYIYKTTLFLLIFCSLTACKNPGIEIEAEQTNAILHNGARRIEASEFSGHGKIGYLGGGKGAAVEIPFEAGQSGIYRMVITYASSDTRPLEVVVNRTAQYEIVCPSTTGFDSCAVVTQFVRLSRGENTISLGHRQKDAPDIDKVSFIPAEKNEFIALGGQLKNSNNQPLPGNIKLQDNETVRQTRLVGTSGEFEFLLPAGTTGILTPATLYGYPAQPVKTNVSAAGDHYDFILVPELKTAETTLLDGGKWQIRYDTVNGTAALSFNGKEVLPQVHAAYTISETVTTHQYTRHAVGSQPVSDIHGNGTCYEIRHSADGRPDLLQRFYLYPRLDYFFTETELIATEEAATNYMAPFVTGAPSAESTSKAGSENNRILFVPFDNDSWVQFGTFTLPGEFLGYEVTALFNPESREGLVIGSVEHDTWKTGIRVDASANNYLTRLECFGGVTSNLTRDLLPHGKVKGKQIKSPKIMVGIFNDWRDGLEEYAAANSRVAPAPAWDKGTPFGWNSWGSIQEKINFDKAIQVSNFVKENLQDNNFSNDSTVYIGLDSFWDNFTDQQLKEFVDHCHSNGQKAGIYWGPFTDWAKNPDRGVEGSNALYKDVYLYANGKPQELDGAWAVDPSHPAVKQRIDYYTQRFHRAGFEYIKIDFLTHGALEADRHADPAITTGIQAYNMGMKYLNNALGGKFYITQAISPLFPSSYAHSRRIACDAFAGIGDSEYTLNGTSYGWWLDKAYRYNDADHLVVSRDNETEGENRARITSGVITGIYMAGDDLSMGGKETTKKRVKAVLTVAGINDIARIGRSFRPVYGDQPSAEKRSEQLFMLEQGDVLYVAAFNFSKEKETEYTIPFERLGLKSGTYPATELWSGKKTTVQAQLECTVPPADVQVWKILK